MFAKIDAMLSHFLSDLQIVFVLVFLVIVPLCNPAGNLWNLIGEATTIQVNTVSQTPIFLLNQLFAMTDSHTFSFYDVLSRLLRCLHTFLRLLKLVFLLTK